MFIGEIRKDGSRFIRVTIERFRGHVFCNVRQWIRNGSGDFFPTPAGITLYANDIKKLLPYLEEAREELESKSAGIPSKDVP